MEPSFGVRGMSLLDLVGPRGAAHLWLQAVCRDIWALHLTLLPSPPAAEPYFHAQSQYGGKLSTSDSPETSVNPQPGNDRPAEDRDGSTECDLEDSKSTSSSSEEEEEDPELERLLRENSVAPSSSEDEDDGAPSHTPITGKQRKQRSTFRPFDSPASNIAILMLACWTLRLPVTYMDFKR